MYKKRTPGVPHGSGRITISKSSNIYEHRGHKKRYNSDLSPIYENIAYLDLEHRHRQTAAHHDEVRDATETEDGETPFQSHRGRHQHCGKRRHSDFPINTRRSGHYPLNHSHRQHRKRQHSTQETHQLEETNTSKRKTKESSRQKQQSPRSEDHSCRPINHSCKSNSEDHNGIENDDINKNMVADRNVFINNKRRLHHTHSDPTNDKTRSRPKKIDYVGYNVIENFLKESDLDSDQMVQKLKTFRSNSEPLVHVPRRLKHALFIDAYEDKSKSLEDIVSNTTDNVPVKLKDDVSTLKHNTKYFKPIEAYKEDTSSCTSNPQPLDDQVPTTSKGLTQSSLYQGHPTLDPTLLHPRLSEYPSNPGNNRRVKLTPLEQRQARSWCPAERKIKKRCFLIFFIILVLGVTIFVLFVIKGWDPIVLLSGKPHHVPISRESNNSSEA